MKRAREDKPASSPSKRSRRTLEVEQATQYDAPRTPEAAQDVVVDPEAAYPSPSLSPRVRPAPSPSHFPLLSPLNFLKFYY